MGERDNLGGRSMKITIDRELSSTFLALDFRWPTPELVSVFRLARDDLARRLHRDVRERWPSILSAYLKRELDKRLLSASPGDFEALKWVLRDFSGLGSMLMHMEPRIDARRSPRLFNRRRRRTDYPTYPTSPLVAKALARYVLERLASGRKGTTTPTRIMDPSMEGGPLLLEIALEVLSRAVGKSGGEKGWFNDLILFGVDQSPVAVSIVSTVLRACLSRVPSVEAHLDLRCGDAFDVLGSCAPLDAVINNPPWGASTDGAGAKDRGKAA